MLLPGESPDLYGALLDEWFAALHPASVPEGAIVARLADLSWKLDRLNGIEHRYALARLEEMIMKTNPGKEIAATQRARVALDALIAAVEGAGIPTSQVGLGPFLEGCAGVLVLVRELDEPSTALTDQFARALDVLCAASSAAAIRESFVALTSRAKEFSGHLRESHKHLSAELNAQREYLAAESLLVDDPNQRRFERYRQAIEKGMEREFDLLRQARERVVANADCQPGDVKVRLRLVR